MILLRGIGNGGFLGSFTGGIRILGLCLLHRLLNSSLGLGLSGLGFSLLGGLLCGGLLGKTTLFFGFLICFLLFLQCLHALLLDLALSGSRIDRTGSAEGIVLRISRGGGRRDDIGGIGNGTLLEMKLGPTHRGCSGRRRGGWCFTAAA